jgi:hypothetical protein
VDRFQKCLPAVAHFPTLKQIGERLFDRTTYHQLGSVMSDIGVTNGDFIVDPTSQIPMCGDHRDSRYSRDLCDSAQCL